MDMPQSDETLAISAIRPTAWRRACVACTRAKRQCTKQVPRCRRCLEKNLQCTYPPPRRPEVVAAVGADGTPSHLNSTTLHPDEGLITVSADTAGSPDDVPSYPDFDFLPMTGAGLEDFVLPAGVGLSGGPPPNTASCDGLVSLRGVWFLAPESWVAEFTAPPPTTTRENEQILSQYIAQVQLWMRQWVTEGHSPLHHRELYTFHMPRHTQDAYTATTMYIGRTHANETNVHRILEDRVSQLLQDQAVEECLGDANGGGLSIFEHLSRVQSLLCYQLIRLYDGDIRMRGQAEALIPTMFLWNKQMLESVKNSLGHPEYFLVSTPFDPNLPLNDVPSTMGDAAFSPKAVWQAWVVAESARRTWQVANLIQEVYQFLKRGWAECPGRLPSTMRKALWNAPSAYLWTKELRGGKDPLLVPLVRLEDILTHVSSAEVDDFNTITIKLYGMEKANQWLDQGAHGNPQLISGLENISHTRLVD